MDPVWTRIHLYIVQTRLKLPLLRYEIFYLILLVFDVAANSYNLLSLFM